MTIADSITEREALHWAAGVIESHVSSIWIEQDRVNVRVVVRKEIALRLQELLGGKLKAVFPVGSMFVVWVVPGKEQKRMLERITPFLRTEVTRDEVSKALMWRIAAPGRGGKLTSEVKRFRRALRKGGR